MRYSNTMQLSAAFIAISLALTGCAISDEMSAEDFGEDIEMLDEEATAVEVIGDEAGAAAALGAADEAGAIEVARDDYSVEFLDLKDLRCGQEEAFSTWFFGKTYVQFVNYDTSGNTEIHLAFNSGPTSGERWVRNQPQYANLSYVGLTLYVRYVGYTDAAGAYHPCNVLDTNTPALQVKTW